MRDIRNSSTIETKRTPYDFSKIRVGKKTVTDAILELQSLNKTTSNRLAQRETVLKALSSNDIPQLIEISQFFFETSGIYNRLCKYLAYLYKYDWYLCPYTTDNILPEEDLKRNEKILKDFSSALKYLENSNIKLNFGNIALSVIKNGAYYGYVIEDDKTRFSMQELPAKYCRTRFYTGDMPVIEFNMKFFDDEFRDPDQRDRILKLFPKEFYKGYQLYKSGQLTPDFSGDQNSWYMLEPGLAFKFNLNNSDYPILVGAIPAIIDLDEAQELDKKKTLQELLKVLIQKVPLDKNNELIFDMEEIQDIHDNAVAMLTNSIGVDVFTTFTDVKIEDVADKNSITSKDDLEKVERNLFNQTGISANLFNADGNISLEKSVLNDEASVYNLILQFQVFLNFVIDRNFNKNKKKYYFKLNMLSTTIYNYMDLYTKYKELVQIGYPKMLPMIALGHSQSSILASLMFENKTLKLSEVMIPPMSSNTMSNKNLGNSGAGRPEKQEGQRSDKTLLNREAMGKES